MSQTNFSKGMPLRLWLMSLLLTILILISLYVTLEIRNKNLRAKHVIPIKHEAYSNMPEKRPKVYFMGSSLTQLAFIEYKSLDSALLLHNINYPYKVVYRPAVSLDDFKDKIDEIRILRPKYLIIESNIVCLNLFGNVLWKKLGRMTIFRYQLARIPLYLSTMGSRFFQLFCQTVPKPMIGEHQDELNLYRMHEIDDNNFEGDRKFIIRKFDEFKSWNSFFAEAHQLGITIYLLEVPRSKEADAHLSKDLKGDFVQLIQQYKKQYHIDFIGFPNKLTHDTYYLDRAHLNKKGAEYYCSWLMNELNLRNIIPKH